MTEASVPSPRVGLVWRGDPGEPAPQPQDTRFRRIFDEFGARGAHAEPVLFSEEAAQALRARLLRLDAVLVWVDPIVNGRDRSVLDAMLRDVAEQGVFVSAHPDTILAMGTKDVLYRTRSMPWGTDTRVHRTLEEFTEQFLPLLRSSGPRVLKQHRGSSGDGVWKVELVRDASPPMEATVRVQHAVRGTAVEDLRFGDFAERCRPYFDAFAGTGCLVDQPYAERLGEGMVRCYLTHDRVVGFGHQYVTALTPPPPGEDRAPDPPPRLYYGPSKPEFQELRALLESGWIAEMQRLLGVARDSLPVIWDADFLLGPRDERGADTYLLCEINVSGVSPMPDEAVGPLVEATLARLAATGREPIEV